MCQAQSSQPARKNRDEIVLSAKYGNAWRPHECSRPKSNFGGNNVNFLLFSFFCTLVFHIVS